MKRSTVAVPARQKSSRTRRGMTASAKLRPPLAQPKNKPAACELPVAPFVPSVDQDLQCCLLGLRDCLTKMRQTEATDRCIRQLDRALKLI